MNADQLRAAFSGQLIPAVPVVFDSDGTINRELHERYVAWMSAQPVGGVAIWAHTGRGLRINPDQRAETLEVWKNGCGHHLIAGVGVPADRQLPGHARALTDAVIQCGVDMATDAREGGASAVLVHPPSVLRDYPDRDVRVAAYHEAVGEVLPFIAFYLYEDAGGILYGDDLVERVVGLPAAIGMKLATLDGVTTVQRLCAALCGRDDVLVISGEDRFLGHSLTLGADSVLIGMGAALTDVFVSLLNRHREKDRAAFAKISDAVDRFSDVAFADPVEGYIQRMLWALKDDDVLPDDAIDPFAPAMDAGERDAVRHAVTQLRLSV